jgi:hypothetical protein
MYTSRLFQNFAQETRALAADATDINAKHLLFSIADAYDRMAELIEASS